MSVASKKRPHAQECKEECKEERSKSPSLGDPQPTFKSIFDEDPPPVMRTIMRTNKHNGTSLSKVQGLVIRVRDDTVQGPKGPIPKTRVDFVVTDALTNGALDIINTGVPGELFYIPSKQVDSPEEAEGGDGKFKLKSRELKIGEDSTLRKVSTAFISFYKEGRDGAATGVNACAPGMTIEVSGICVNEGISSKTGLPALYLNGGKLTCTMAEAPDPGALAPHMMAICKRENMQMWSAFGCSVAAKGFYTTHGMNDAQAKQAAACQNLWKKVIDNTADRLGTLASSSPDVIASVLQNHETRVRAINPAMLACGDCNLFVTDPNDCTIAPIVNEGVTPWDNMPAFYKAMVAGGKDADDLPNMFSIPFTWQVVVGNGNGMTMEARVLYCFDKDAALEAKEKGVTQPLLATPGSAIAMNLSMKDMSFKFGTTIKQKLGFAVKQILPIADFAAFPKMYHIESTSSGDSLVKDFPVGGTIYIDMPATLQKTAILVSEGMIKKEMCEGNTQYVPDADQTSERYSLPDGVTDLPTFAKHRYQELTYGTASGSGGFKFSNFKVLSGKLREYRIVYEGTVVDLEADKELATNVEKGDKHITKMAMAHNMDLKDFITQKCLVYAIMV